jgi:hypothetical protein
MTTNRSRARVTIKLNRPRIPVVDPCTNRKLVYNNSLLYDLIYCNHGDLPHIVDFTWRKAYPTREIGVDEFTQMMRDGLTSISISR